MAPNSRPHDGFHPLRDFQNGPPIERPNLAESFIPVVGPTWEAAADLQDGNYAGAAFNGAMAIADALPVGVAIKGVRAASKGIGVLKKGSLTANAAQKMMRRKLDLVGEPFEVHHSIALNGIKRNVPNWRNHNALLKVLPTETHRRLTGSYNNLPKFGPMGQLWHGTTDWQKIVPTALAGLAADTVENFQRDGTLKKSR